MKSSMDKPRFNNGFTLVEMLMVILIVSLFMVSVISIRPINSLSIFMEKMMSYCVLTQEKAYVEKKRLSVDIQRTYAQFDDIVFQYPKMIVCEPNHFFYNGKGNISKPDTIICRKQNQEKKLIFQLGSGRVRVE